MQALLLIGLGVTFSLLGLLQLNPKIREVDTKFAKEIQHSLLEKASFFRYIWPLGSTPVALILVCMAFIQGWQEGTIIAITFVAISTIERAAKIKIDRTRPFIDHTEIELLQPTTPSDPSHPSGDAMRAWFLAVAIPITFHLNWPVAFTTCVIAGLLSIGRVVLGAHYPLDVIGGIGYGVIGAGFSTLGFQLLAIN
jgi:membrane-associated phospholipid phosphatase